ncbi:MAG: sodium:solute symporter family transporter [Planctomycetota bacterium]|jgi:sodium/proline symporter
MDRSTAILVALIAFLVALLVIGFRASRRTHDSDGFYLGGRSLGPWVAALAANASSSSAWSIVGASGFAYRFGMTALWLIPGCVGGFLLNWFVVAPRLRADTGDAITLTDYLAGPVGAPGRRRIAVFASLLTLASLLTYVAAQMQAAGAAFGHAFPATFGGDASVGIVIGAVVTVLYTLFGGYLAASVTDTVQGLLMAAVAVVVPAAALVHAGGVGPFFDAVANLGADGTFTELDRGIDAEHWLGLGGANQGAAAFAFAFGLVGIGLGYPGQPHAVNKYMGMSPDASMTVARTVGLTWAVVLYTGMLVLGWSVRIWFPMAAGEHESAIYEASKNLLPVAVDGVVVASVLAAIMSTVDSQLLVCASSVSHDLGLARRFPDRMLAIARGTVLAIGLGALVAALLLPKDVFGNVMFAWAALGSAFGPILLVRLCVGPVAPNWGFLSMLVGGGSAVLFFYVNRMQLTDVPAGFLDRVVSWLLALVIAFVGTRRASR